MTPYTHTHTHTHIRKETRTYASVRVLSLYELAAAAAASVPTLVRQFPTPLPLFLSLPYYTDGERDGRRGTESVFALPGCLAILKQFSNKFTVINLDS